VTSDETMYGLKYQELIPVLINAIKELPAEFNISILDVDKRQTTSIDDLLIKELPINIKKKIY
jgi:hypothetical protein